MSRRRYAPQRETTRRKSRGKKPVFLIFLLLLGALLWFAPTIAVKTPLKDRLIASATSDFDGKIVVDSVSAGWLSPLQASNIVAFDSGGERLVEVPAVTLDKNLVSLISDRSDLGTIRIQRPVANIIIRADGSNVEDAIAAWLAPSEETSEPMACAIEVEEGTINVMDATTGAQWSARNLNVALAMPKEPAAPLKVNVDTELQLSTGHTGKLVEKALEKAAITVNKNTIPFDPKPPLVASGIRIGTPAVTSRGMGEEQMVEIADLIGRALESPEDDAHLAEVKRRVIELCERFPLYPPLPG